MSDKEFYHLTVSINKALNPIEAPLKMKHARSVIISTHRTKEGKSFWMVTTRQPLMEIRFTAWKFCHLLHKVLREGHHSIIKQSQTHKKMILEMGKLWGHLQDGVGSCIQSYSKLIVTKLDFHEKNAMFPGSLMVDFRDIEKFAEDDINIYFQLCVEIFDYLDDILDVQLKVFTSINTYRMSSMTPQGQCRLAPLITLIQDSNPLYDQCVRVMFKLHDKLPSDVLCGHRDRFRDLFAKLKQFYDNVRPLQYFSDLIQVPHLPETAPNFTSRLDFGSYIPPVMFVQPDPEPVIENLVDMSILQTEQEEQSSNAHTSDEVLRLKDIINDNEYTIRELQKELTAIQAAYISMERNYQRDVTQLRNEISGLGIQLASTDEMYINMRSLKDDLELKLATTPTLIQKVADEEEKSKTSEEKFNKIKTLYSQLREEHINLLRQHSESTKLANKEKQISFELQTENTQLKSRLTDLEQEVNVQNKKCEEISELKIQFQEMERKYDLLQATHEDLKKDYEKQSSCKSADIEQLTTKTIQLEEHVAELEECKSKMITLENTLDETNVTLRQEHDKYEEIIKNYKENLGQQTSSMTELKTALNIELESKVSELNECKSKMIALKKSLDDTNVTLKQEHDKYEEIVESCKKDLERQAISMTELKAAHDIELESKVSELHECKSKIVTLEKSLDDTNVTLKQEHDKYKEIVENCKKDLERQAISMTELKAAHDIEVQSKISEINNIRQKYDVTEIQLKEKELQCAKLTDEKLLIESEIQDLVQQNIGMENKLKTVIDEKEAMVLENRTNQIKYESCLSSLLHCVFTTMEYISSSKIDGVQQESFEHTLQALKDMEKLLNEIDIVYGKYNMDSNFMEGLTRKSILLGHNFTMLHEQCLLIYNTTTDIDKGQDIFNKINSVGDSMHKLFQQLRNNAEIVTVQQSIASSKKMLADLEKLINDLIKSLSSNVELGDLVENELAEMDQAIEEAAGKFAEMLSNARSQYEGIKLEVNEKILDACTTLMECIKLLIKKSKFLQEEIVSSGKGNTSVKEFYKRNSQWTEGLISASKSVAKGANLLLEAANKAVTSESSQNFEIIVAAQEIAACTAQLVIASKVKAPKGSQKLLDLTKASRSVSQATGAVVATVKDCNISLEQSVEVDLTKLTSSQVKTMEMELHVKVLELEQALQVERLKLSSFRRNHYQNTE